MWQEKRPGALAVVRPATWEEHFAFYLVPSRFLAGHEEHAGLAFVFCFCFCVRFNS